MDGRTEWTDAAKTISLRLRRGIKKKIEKRERGIEKVGKKEGKSDLASDMNDSCADHYLAYNFFVKDFSLF